MKDNIEVRCCNCDWQGDEDELILVETDESIHSMDNRLDRDFMKACPKCLTDHYLTNIKEEALEVGLEEALKLIDKNEAKESI